MIIAYDYVMPKVESPIMAFPVIPVIGSRVMAKGSPDSTPIQGLVVTKETTEADRPGLLTLGLYFDNEQRGAREFQEWVTAENDIGVQVLPEA